MTSNINIERERLLGSYLLFAKTFYKELTSREFIISSPPGRFSHHITIAQELTKVFKLETSHLLINIPPGFHKSTMLIFWVAWCMAHYPDCNFLYVSYSHVLAAKHTYTIKKIMELQLYKDLFDVHINRASSAKHDFSTSKGGYISAFGSAGSITGRDAGLPYCDRFSGALIMDDMHKPIEAHSDVTRESVITNCQNTLPFRLRGTNVPSIFLGQRLRQDDYADFLIQGKGGNEWKTVILQGLDEKNQSLDPNIKTAEQLLTIKEHNPSEFWAQIQQMPQPPGGSLFKDDWWMLLDEEPEIRASFITIDTAEGNNNYGDYTVLSFFGIYDLKHGFSDVGMYGLHWIDCVQERVPVEELQEFVLDFYGKQLLHKCPPRKVAIEKKSTGVTLLAVLKQMQGIEVQDIERTKASGSKTARFLEMVPYVARKQISMHRYAKHTRMCIDHMSKITDNETHSYDDIADTLYDGINLGLTNKNTVLLGNKNDTADKFAKMVGYHDRRIASLRGARQW